MLLPDCIIVVLAGKTRTETVFWMHTEPVIFGQPLSLTMFVTPLVLVPSFSCDYHLRDISVNKFPTIIAGNQDMVRLRQALLT